MNQNIPFLTPNFVLHRDTFHKGRQEALWVSAVSVSVHPSVHTCRSLHLGSAPSCSGNTPVPRLLLVEISIGRVHKAAECMEIINASLDTIHIPPGKYPCVCRGVYISIESWESGVADLTTLYVHTRREPYLHLA